jgi:hypothetical protein
VNSRSFTYLLTGWQKPCHLLRLNAPQIIEWCAALLSLSVANAFLGLDISYGKVL